MRQRHVNQKRSPITLMVWSLVIGPILLVNSGCSVVMATRQPDKKDLTVLDEGTPRNQVVAELGAPILTEEKDGNKVDTFAFVQGYSKGSRTGRAVFHGIADVFTLGLWEVVGTPIESIASGTDMKIEVVYDENDLVMSVTHLEVEKPEASEEAASPSEPPSPSGSPWKEDDPTTAPFRM